MKIIATTVKADGHVLDRVACGSCREILTTGDAEVLQARWRFCPYCGIPLDWTGFISRYGVGKRC